MVDENSETPDDRRSQQHLANERTFLSWLRTCIAFVGLGFVVARFGFFLEQFGLVVQNSENSPLMHVQTGHFQSTVLGISVVIIGILLLLLALRSYVHTTRAIEKEDFTPNRFNIYASSISLLILSFGIVIYLLLFLT